jgi:AbiV family abortive infection protein
MSKAINKISYLDGYKITIDNAKSLSRLADKSAEEESFGSACSLNILAAEESIKAVFMLTKHFNEDSEIDDFDKVFKDHKTKHEHLLNIFVAHRAVLKLQIETIERFKPVIKIVENLPELQQQEMKEKFKVIYDHAERVNKQMQRQIPIEVIKKWLDDANLEKNRGFYVDKGHTTWHDPKNFVREKYEEERKYTLSFIEDAEAMLEIFDISSLEEALKRIQNSA